MTEMTIVSEMPAEEELIYNTSTVSKLLGVHDKTLRNYCSLMQNCHYEFQKNRNGHRLYYKKDIELIKKIIDLKNATSISLNDAVKTVLQAHMGEIDTTAAPKKESTAKSNADFDKILDEFSAFKNEQMEFNKRLLEQLIKQENYIKTSIEERDKKLMFAMKESMEARRQLAAAAAEAEEQEKSKKRVWWKFWQHSN